MSDVGSGAPDPFTRFWTDVMSKAFSGAGPTASPGSQTEEAARHMRQAFFDAWSRQCEEFMRSDEFLKSMKDSMDHALAFRRKMNEFLSSALERSQMTLRGDVDAILQTLHRIEERLLDRVGAIEARLDALEQRRRSRTTTPRVDPKEASR